MRFSQKITELWNMCRREKLLCLNVMLLKCVVYGAANVINTYVIIIKLDAERKLENKVKNILENKLHNQEMWK